MSSVEASDATRLQAWLDKSELAELLAVLASAVDRGDRELIGACYAEESYDDHGVFKGSGREFAEYVCAPPSDPTSQRKMHHLLGQSVFDVHGDEAWGETFFIFHSVDGSDCQPGFGRFIDYFQRIDSTWKVKYRRVVPDKTAAGYDSTTYASSSRDRSDPLYDHLTWPQP
jgi:hypothetical protein